MRLIKVQLNIAEHMAAVQIDKNTIAFLKNLSENNNRDWFNAHKPTYIEAHENVCSFVDALILEMNKHDELVNESGKKSIFRIYTDVRFSKDKSPYNARFALSLQRATKFKRGGYYMNIKPGNSFLACGFWGPNPDDLKRIRQDIAEKYTDWNKLLKKKSIAESFGSITGEQVLTAPKGYSKDHPAIDLIRHKQFIFRHNFKDKDIIAPDFLKTANTLYKSIRPFFDYMSEVLTTDGNGEVNV